MQRALGGIKRTDWTVPGKTLSHEENQRIPEHEDIYSTNRAAGAGVGVPAVRPPPCQLQRIHHPGKRLLFQIPRNPLYGGRGPTQGHQIKNHSDHDSVCVPQTHFLFTKPLTPSENPALRSRGKDDNTSKTMD